MEVKRRKKKKGRPSKTPNLSPPPKPIMHDSATRRSTRHNPNFANFDESDEDDERKEKKVKLVVRLPQSGDKIGRKNRRDSTECDSESASRSGPDFDSDPESEEQVGNGKRRRINAVDGGSTVALSDQVKKFVKPTDNPNGTGWPLESVSTTPLPDKKLLIFILQRLQKKDTRGVFSEPVDPDELPDYHEIIKQPMDFGTVNKKLDTGAYKSLEELEADVLLICSNAMTYNPPDSIYHRQARSIQELAARDFENLRHEGDDGQPQPKVVRRGRPPGKNPKKPVETSPIDRVGPEISSGATLASGEGKATGSNSYNLRKAPPPYTYRSMDPYVSTIRSRNGENCYELSTDWNGEFPASILRADMKYGKKHFNVDETRRDTYGQIHPLSYGNEPHVLSSSFVDVKQLVPVGLHDPLAYARSLARYAAHLGPVAWKIASQKIESVLPDGVQYGPGWVGEAPSHPSPFQHEKWRPSNNTDGGSRNPTPSTSDLNSAFASKGIAEAVRRLNSQSEPSFQGDASSWRMQFPAQQKPIYHPQRNGFSGMHGYHLSAAGVSFPRQMVETIPVNEEAKLPESWGSLPTEYPKEQVKISESHVETESWNSGKPSWQESPMQQRHNLSVPPDLNLRVPAVSPSSSLQIGSPKQQPDLALQL